MSGSLPIGVLLSSANSASGGEFSNATATVAAGHRKVKVRRNQCDSGRVRLCAYRLSVSLQIDTARRGPPERPRSATAHSAEILSGITPSTLC